MGALGVCAPLHLCICKGGVTRTSRHGLPHQGAAASLPPPDVRRLQDVAGELLAGAPRLLCPRLSPALNPNASTLPRLTGPGCPCNLSSSSSDSSPPAAFRCPAGHRCGPAARYRLLLPPVDLAAGAAGAEAEVLGGVCVPCGGGQRCEEGTVEPVRGVRGVWWSGVE